MPAVIPMAIAAFSTVATAATAILTGAGITGSIILDTAIALGASAGINALTAPDVKSAPAQLNVKVGAVQPRTMIMGRTAVAGLAVTPSMRSGRDNGIGSFVRVLSGAGESGVIEKLLWDDEEVTVSSNPASLGGSRWIKYNNGSWTQSAININSGVPSFETGGQPAEWTTNHKCVGCMTAMLMIGLFNEPVKSNGIASKIAFVVNNTGASLTDPRTGVAATGAALYNPFVWAYSYAIGWFSPTGEKIGGGGLTTANIHTASFSYAANVADTNSFTIAGELVLDDSEFLNNIRAISQAGGGDITTRGGQLYATVAAARSVVYYVTEDDFRAAPSYRNALESSQVPNAIIPRFRNPDNGYEIIDGSAVTDATFLSDDDGNAKVIPTTFPFCGGGATQAGKLAGLALVNAREQIAHSLPLKTQCRYKALVGDCVEYDTPNYRLDGVKISIESVTINNDLSVDWEAITETSTKYAWALGQTTTAPSMAIITAFDPTTPVTPDAADWTATAATISSGTGADLPIVSLAGAVPVPENVSSIVPYISVDGGTTWLQQAPIVPTETTFQIIGVTPDTSYDIGLAYTNNAGVISPITTIDTITTDPLQINTPQIVAGAVSNNIMSSGSSVVSATAGTTQTVEILTHTTTTTGGVVSVDATVNLQTTAKNSAETQSSVYLYCDGTLLTDITNVAYTSSDASGSLFKGGFPIPLSWMHTPSAGSHTYSLKAVLKSLTNETVKATERTIRTMEFKV